MALVEPAMLAELLRQSQRGAPGTAFGLGMEVEGLSAPTALSGPGLGYRERHPSGSSAPDSRRGSELSGLPPLPSASAETGIGDITAAHVMDLLAAHGVVWRDSVLEYFRTTHPWLSIVHPQLFWRSVARFDPVFAAASRDAHLHPGGGTSSGRHTPDLASTSAAVPISIPVPVSIQEPTMDNGGIPDNVALALLLACMHLVTEGPAAADIPAGRGRNMLRRPLFTAVRRLWAMTRVETRRPSAELIQCGMLLCLYEFGHGDPPRAFVTLGDAVAMARVLQVRPGKYVEALREEPVEDEDEQRRGLYWGLFVLDK